MHTIKLEAEKKTVNDCSTALQALEILMSDQKGARCTNVRPRCGKCPVELLLACRASTCELPEKDPR
eukprot:scaffold82368_cov16-Tisochrysis_lutea.AAC.4